MRCPLCKSELQVLSYQGRSADEAHTEVTRCVKCVLDAAKFEAPPKPPHTFLPRSGVEVRHTPRRRMANPMEGRILSVSSRSTTFDVHELLGEHAVPKKAMASNILDENSRLYKSYTTGPWVGQQIAYGTPEKITLNASLCPVHIAREGISGSRSYVDFEYYEYEGFVLIVEETRVVATCMVGSDEEVLTRIEVLYLMGFCPGALGAFVENILLGSISNLNARSHDASSANEDEHYFSSKPDGERMWLVLSGSVWFYCRRLVGFSIVSFAVDSTVRTTTKPLISVVLDVEILLYHPPILIDILAPGHNVLAPYDRSVPWINDTMATLQTQYPYLQRVCVRPFFRTLREARAYTGSVSYPTDGMVAISHAGTDMKKLKKIKSVELEYKEGGLLCSREGTPMMQLHGKTLPIGAIVEVRFSIEEGRFVVREHFVRSDKRTPNDEQAIECILSSTVKIPEENRTRTTMWRWSNALRLKIYERAGGFRKTKNVVLDIGTGTGQSSDAYSKLGGCAFILIEPDEKRCKDIARRLGLHSFGTDPRIITRDVQRLRKAGSSSRYLLVNCTLQDILRDPSVMKTIHFNVKCAIACFSAHYVIGELDRLYDRGRGIPYIGCFYSYDNIPVGGSIVDEGGVSMKRITEEEAVVKWGRDREYHEIAVTKDLYPLSAHVTRATQLEPLGAVSDSIKRACGQVQILTSGDVAF